MTTEDDVSRTMEYLFKKGTNEVKHFNKPEFIKKIAVENKGILFSRSRIMDGQRMSVAEGLENLDFLKSFKPYQCGISLVSPVLDKFSPLAISIAMYIHETLFPHHGYESSFRYSLDYVFIVEGQKLFRELGEDCVECNKLRKKYLDLAMGLLPDENFTVAPCFYVTQLDIYGPVHLYVPGHSFNLRNKKTIEAKCYVLVAADPISRSCNLQVIENKAVDGILDGLTRLSCEVGVPKLVLTDQDSGIMKALEEAQVSLKDMQHVCYKEKGIMFKTCPVSGHNQHGFCERMIQSVQECLTKMKVDTMRLHATGYQTLMKLIENQINSLPIGITYGRARDNSPLLQLIYPNLLRLGRNNQRMLDGPITLPKNPGQLMKKVEDSYAIFYELFDTVMIPKLMKAVKWYDTKAQLSIGDVVYFKKVEGELSSTWTVGLITDVVHGKDGVVRRCQVQYQNASEDKKRTTDRAARSLIKLFNIDDTSWREDLGKLDRLLEEVNAEDENETVVALDSSHNCSLIGLKLELWSRGKKASCKEHCCVSHCVIDTHGRNAKKFTPVQTEERRDQFELFDKSWWSAEQYKETLTETDNATATMDNLTSLIVRTQLDLEEGGEAGDFLSSGHVKIMP